MAFGALATPLIGFAVVKSEPQYYALTVREFFEYRNIDPVPFLKIAYCESQFDNKAYNSLTHDSGLMQINKLHWKTMKKMGLNIKNPEHQLLYSLLLYNQNGLRDWSASAKCQSSPKTTQRIRAILDG